MDISKIQSNQRKLKCDRLLLIAMEKAGVTIEDLVKMKSDDIKTRFGELIGNTNKQLVSSYIPSKYELIDNNNSNDEQFIEEHPFIKLKEYKYKDNINWIVNIQKDYKYFGYIPDKANTLIIGTFPPKEDNGPLSYEFDFFYGLDERNGFWKMINELFKLGHSFNTKDKMSIEKAFKFLDENKIGITDIIWKTNRLKNTKGKFDANDKNIEPVYYNDILQLLIENPTIENLIVTSGMSSASYNNKSAVGLIADYFSINIDITEFKIKDLEITKENKETKGFRELVSKEISKDLYILYSPSRNATRGIPGGEEGRKEQWINIFKKINKLY